MKSDEEKQKTLDARNKRRREAAAKVKTEELMADVATLAPGDTFILDEAEYIVLSIDSLCNHIHADLVEGDGWRQIAFGTTVDVIAKGKKEEAKPKGKVAVVSTPVSTNPAVTGGRWFK